MSAAAAVSSATHVGVPAPGGSRTVQLPELLQGFGADILIRLHARDFGLLAQAGPILTHFNLPHAANPIGSRCVILPIIRPGRFLPGGREIVPVLDPSRFRMATCLDLADHVALTEVTAEQFATSLPTIRDADALRTALVQRYENLGPHSTEAEIVAGGCSVTRLRLDDAQD